MSERTKKIGVFDSGFGGLNILSYVVKSLPAYDYVYLGDTARVPYGNRSAETVYLFTVQALEFLFNEGCDLVILACNTASSDALRKIQQEYLPKSHPTKKVLGVIIPACESVSQITLNNKVGLIATKGTVSSGAFEREMANYAPDVKLFSIACPLLVPVIESGEESNTELLNILFNTYLTPLIKAEIDTLILACTHYGIIEDQIAKFLGSKVNIVNEGPIIALKLAEYLKKHPEIECNLSQNAGLIAYTTDLPIGFKQLGEKFFGGELDVKRAKLEI